MPWRLSRLRMCSITGRPTIGAIGLGRETVKGLSREPSPPAMTTAFILPALPHSSLTDSIDAIRRVAKNGSDNSDTARVILRDLPEYRQRMWRTPARLFPRVAGRSARWSGESRIRIFPGCLRHDEVDAAPITEPPA